MEYSLQPSKDRTHIVLTVVGDVTGKQMMKAILEAHARGNELGINRYLVDATAARNIDSIMGNYDFAYRDMKETEGVDTLARVAAFVSAEDKSHDFIETVLRNAGLDIKIFNNLEMAREYLKK